MDETKGVTVPPQQSMTQLESQSLFCFYFFSKGWNNFNWKENNFRRTFCYCLIEPLDGGQRWFYPSHTGRLWATDSKIPGAEGNRQIRPLCKLKWDDQFTSCKGKISSSPKLLVGGLTGRKHQSMFYWSSASSLTATHPGILLKTILARTLITPIKTAGTGLFTVLSYVFLHCVITTLNSFYLRTQW